jgi:hypothetical protein
MNRVSYFSGFNFTCMRSFPEADPGLGGGGAHLKKLRRAEGGANIFGVFRVKNHDFTPKNHIFSNFSFFKTKFVIITSFP